MPMTPEELEAMMNPKPPEFKQFMLEILGKPKTSKTTLALTASKFCPPPAQWDPKKPVELKDMAWLQFEPNALMYAAGRGIIVPNVFDWSSESLTVHELDPMLDRLPKAAEGLRARGVTTIVVDTVTAFYKTMLRDVIKRPTFAKDMERIRAYGLLDQKIYSLIDNVRDMKMNMIFLMHLEPFQPFGEEGGKSDVAADMKKQAEKRIDVIESMNAGGLRSAFVPDCRPKPAAHLTRLADAVLVANPRLVTVRAGVQEMKYEFSGRAGGEYAAGGRWDLPEINDGFLYSHIEKKYGPTK